MIARWALLGAVLVQITDSLTFAAGLRSGIPLEAEANPVARHLYGSFGIAGVIDVKLAVVAAIILALALAQRVAPRQSIGRRRVLVGAVVLAAGGLFGTVANLAVLLPVLRVALSGSPGGRRRIVSSARPAPPGCSALVQSPNGCVELSLRPHGRRPGRTGSTVPARPPPTSRAHARDPRSPLDLPCRPPACVRRDHRPGRDRRSRLPGPGGRPDAVRRPHPHDRSVHVHGRRPALAQPAMGRGHRPRRRP